MRGNVIRGSSPRGTASRNPDRRQFQPHVCLNDLPSLRICATDAVMTNSDGDIDVAVFAVSPSALVWGILAVWR
jgi:hypothetical protein